MVYSRYLYRLLFLFLSFFAHAQFTLEGNVYDAEGNPVSAAEVKANEWATKTDSLGYFVFSDLPKGNYTLTFIHKEITQKKEIELSQDYYNDFFLEPELASKPTSKENQTEENQTQNQTKDYNVLNIFQPTKSRDNLDDVEGTAIYSGKKTEVVRVEKMMGNKSTGNPREIYAQVAGLNIYENNRSGLQLNLGGRGLDPSRTANFNTRQNGYDISADVLGYPESYYTPPAEAVEEIQIVRGAAALQYGTQFGGLINFKLKDPSKKVIEWESRETVGSYNLFTTFNRLSGTKDKVAYQVYYNRKTGNNFRSNSDFTSNNLFGQLAYSISKNTQLTFESTFMRYLEQQPGGLTDEQFAQDPSFSNRTRNWFNVNWQLYALRLDHAFDAKNKLSLQLFALDASRKSLGFRGSPGEANITAELDEQDPIDGSFVNPRDLITGEYLNWGAEARYLKEFTFFDEKSFLLLGGKYYQSDNTSRQGAGSYGTDADFSFIAGEEDYFRQSDFINPNLNFAAFTEWIIPVGKKLRITPGLRFESIRTETEGAFYDVPSDQFVQDSRVLPRSFILKGLGISYKHSRKTELYGNISENYRSFTFSDIQIRNGSGVVDKNLADESGYSFDLGTRGMLYKVLQYDISTYLVTYDNRIGEFINGSGIVVTSNLGGALVQGTEGFLSLDIIKTAKLSTQKWKANTFVNLAYTRSAYQNSNSQANIAGNRLELVPRWNVKTGLQLGYKNLSSALQYSYISEQFSEATNAIDPSPNGIIGLIPAYGVMDWSWTWSLKKFRLEGGLNNLLNKSYFTQRASGYPGPGIIPSDPRMFYLTLGWKL